MDEAVKKEAPKKEHYEGMWNGKSVRFNRNWNGYRFNDAECEALCNGDGVTFQAVSKRTGKTYQARGMLSEQDFNGKKYVGFNLCMIPEGVYVYDDTKVKHVPGGTGPLTQEEDDLFAKPLGGRTQEGKQDAKQEEMLVPGVLAGESKEQQGVASAKPAWDAHTAYGPDLSADVSDVAADASKSALSKVGHVAGTVVKGAAIAAGVGLLAGTAATASAVKKSKSKKDEYLSKLADDAGFALGQAFASNAWEQRAISKAIEEVSGKPAGPMSRRRLPDLPMEKEKDAEPELD